MTYVSNIVTQRLEILADAADSDLVISHRKAINTLFPYAIFLEQSGQRGMIDAVLRTARVSDSKFSNQGKFAWHRVVLYISRLFEKQSPTSLNRLITLISPYVPWDGVLDNQVAVSRWAAAALATPRTQEVDQNVVDALLQIATIDFLRPHIPVEVWTLLKRRPSLPPVYRGIEWAECLNTFAYLPTFEDTEILKSLFLLVWSDQCTPHLTNLGEMESSIRWNFGGTEMERHRKDLIERLDHVLHLLDQMEESPSVREKKVRYTSLRNVLLEVGKQ